MSNLTEFVSAVSSDSGDAVAAAGGLIGVVSQIVGAVSGAISIVQWFTNLGQPSNQAIQTALDQLQKAVNDNTTAIDIGQAVLGLQANYQAIDALVNPAKGWFGLLTQIDPKDETSVTSAKHDCYTAMISLRDDVVSYWMVPWAGGVLAYSDEWSGQLYPPHTDQVFNYFYALPQFIRSISFYLAVVSVLRPSDLILADLGLCADTLHSIHDDILAKLLPSVNPQASDVAYVTDKGDLLELRTSWYDRKVHDGPLGSGPGLWPFGAIEEYSGMSAMDSYWVFLPFRIDPRGLNPGSSIITESFVRLVKLRIEDRRKKLYTSIGLPAVREAVKQLRIIVGESPANAPAAFEIWSLRGALNILGISLGGSGVFQSIRKFLQTIPPYCGGSLFPPPGGNYLPSPLPTSLRSLFAPISVT